MDVGAAGGTGSGATATDGIHRNPRIIDGTPRISLESCKKPCDFTDGRHWHTVVDGEYFGLPHETLLDGERAIKVVKATMGIPNEPTLSPIGGLKRQRRMKEKTAPDEEGVLPVTAAAPATAVRGTPRCESSEAAPGQIVVVGSRRKSAPPVALPTRRSPSPGQGASPGETAGPPLSLPSPPSPPSSQRTDVSEAIGSIKTRGALAAVGAVSRNADVGRPFEGTSGPRSALLVGTKNYSEDEEGILPVTTAAPATAVRGAPRDESSGASPRWNDVPRSRGLNGQRLAERESIGGNIAMRGALAAIGAVEGSPYLGGARSASDGTSSPRAGPLSVKEYDTDDEVEVLGNREQCTASQNRTEPGRPASSSAASPALEGVERPFYLKERISLSQEFEVDVAFYGGRDSEILVEAFGVQLTRASLKSLQPGTWLDDEVLNMCMNLLQARDKELCQKDANRRPSLFFNSFFFTKLTSDDPCGSFKFDYEGVKRWTHTVNIFDLDKLYVPVNINKTHWCLVVVYIQRKRFNFYDSLGGRGKAVIDSLVKWLKLEDEHKNGGKGTSGLEWDRVRPNKETDPMQGNNHDCGAFLVSYAACINDGLPFDFCQDDMPQIRQRIVWSLLHQSLA
eukprot:g16638.t1